MAVHWPSCMRLMPSTTKNCRDPTARFGPLLRTSTDTALARIVPAGPRRYRLAVITNSGDNNDDVIERVTEAGTVDEHSRPLGLNYPRGFYSLSHVALPFPVSD